MWDEGKVFRELSVVLSRWKWSKLYKTSVRTAMAVKHGNEAGRAGVLPRAERRLW